MKQNLMKSEKVQVNKLDNILERGKKFLDYMTSSIYDTSETNLRVKQVDTYNNPFSGVNNENNMGTLDRIELLEYSQEYSEKQNKLEKESISISNESNFFNCNEMNIKEYENFILKIEDLIILDNKILHQIQQTLIYIECRVPLFRDFTNKEQSSQLFYDTFNKGSLNKNQSNIFQLMHVSYHKLKLEEDNFGILANSKIEFYLHKLITKPENSDIIIGKGEIDFNRVFLSKDFFYTVNLEIYSFTDNENKLKSTEIKRKKPAGRQTTKNIEKKQIEIDKEISFKIADLQISCQLFKNNLDREKDIKENIRQKEKVKLMENIYMSASAGDEDEEMKLEQKNNKAKTDLNITGHITSEYKIDYDDILVLYLGITNLKPLNPDDTLFKNTTHNFFISHKIFPGTCGEVASSEIKWNSGSHTNFNYQMMMPFILNSRTIEMLDCGCLMIEVWNKANNQDELLGTVKLELSAILESLRIAEDTLSITPISKNLIPLIIYDGFYPVFNYKEFINVFFLNLTLGFGTTTQVNNYMKKQNNLNPQELNRTSTSISNNGIVTNKQMIQSHESGPSNSNNIPNNSNEQAIRRVNLNVNVDPQTLEKQIIDDELNDINKLLNGNKISQDDKHSLNKYKNDDIDVEEILERNKKELDNINNFNNKYKYSTSSLGETKKYEGNPFLLREEIQNQHGYDRGNSNFNTKTNFNPSNTYTNPYTLINPQQFQISSLNHTTLGNVNKVPGFQVSKESNFDLQLEKFTENEFFKQNNFGGASMNQSQTYDKNIPNFESLGNYVNHGNHVNYPQKTKEIQINPGTPLNNTDESIRINNNPNTSIIHGIKHNFDIHIDKLINLHVLNKINNKCYLKYTFLNENELIKSDTLRYSNYNKESCVIDVDMKSSHSIFLSKTENIKDHLSDFYISMNYFSEENEEVVFGIVSLPCEELIGLTSENSDELVSTVFIYGTDKIKRQDCIIGKMKLDIKYVKTVVNSSSFENILIEKQTVFNRKIPKNASIIFKINYFKYDDNFRDCIDLSNNSNFFYLEIDPFQEDKLLRKKNPKQITERKYQSVNGVFEKEFYFNVVIESDILEYIKNKFAFINLVGCLGDSNKKYFYNEYTDDMNNISDDYGDVQWRKNELDSSTDEKKKIILGSAKIKFSDIISNTDYINKSLAVTTNNKYKIIGYINVDMKLENSEDIKKNNPNQTHGSGNHLVKNCKTENLTEALSLKHERSSVSDGKYLFIINLFEIIYEENFHKKLIEYTCNNFRTESNNNLLTLSTQFYFMYKFGKNKKISPIYDTRSKIEIFGSPTIYLQKLKYTETLEFVISFSKNKPEDIIKQLTENIFEIKLFVKTHGENLHTGSFMIDLSKILNSECRINKDIFFSEDCYLYYFDNISKQQETLKLRSSYSLVRSDIPIEQFKQMYQDTFQSISNINNIHIFRKFNSNSQINFKKVLSGLILNSTYYEYLDLYLFNLEDDNADIIAENFFNLYKFFGGDTNLLLTDNLEILNYIDDLFRSKKLMLRKSIGLSNSKYLIPHLNFAKLIPTNNINELLSFYFENNKKNNFCLYSTYYDKSIDLFDFIMYFYKFYRKEDIDINNENLNENENSTFNYNLYNNSNLYYNKFTLENNYISKKNISKNIDNDKTYNKYIDKYKKLQNFPFYDDPNLDTKSLWDKFHKNSDIIQKLTQDIDLKNLNEKQITKEEDNFSTIERERKMTENKLDSYNNHSNLIIDMDKINMDLFDNLENSQILKKEDIASLAEDDYKLNDISEPNLLPHMKNDDQNISHHIINKAYSDYQQNNFEDFVEKKTNKTLLDNLQNKVNKPPLPAFNRLYQNADKQFLNRIQKILKKKDTKKLTYASSEESN